MPATEAQRSRRTQVSSVGTGRFRRSPAEAGQQNRGRRPDWQYRGSGQCPQLSPCGRPWTPRMGMEGRVGFAHRESKVWRGVDRLPQSAHSRGPERHRGRRTSFPKYAQGCRLKPIARIRMCDRPAGWESGIQPGDRLWCHLPLPDIRHTLRLTSRAEYSVNVRKWILSTDSCDCAAVRPGSGRGGAAKRHLRMSGAIGRCAGG
jgi:hypothetical protein